MMFDPAPPPVQLEEEDELEKARVSYIRVPLLLSNLHARKSLRTTIFTWRPQHIMRSN